MDKIIKSFTETNNNFICNIQSFINTTTIDLKNEIMALTYKNKKLNEEINDFKKVSFIKNLNNQLKEKDEIIKTLENEIDILKKKSISTCEVLEAIVEEEVVVAEEEEEEVVVAEEEEVEVVVAEEEEVEVVVAEEEEVEVVVAEEEEVEVVVAEEEEVEEEVVEEVEEEVVAEEEEVEEVEEVVVAEVEEEEDEEVEEVEVDFIEKKLKPPNSTSRKLKWYFITDDENNDIYEN